MRKISVQFPIVVYPSESEGMGRFTAHCLNLDVLSDSDSVEGAISELLDVIEQQLDAAEEYRSDPFRKAPDEYWQMLGQSRALPRELLERIVNHANERHAADEGFQPLDVSQVEVRELESTSS